MKPVLNAIGHLISSVLLIMVWLLWMYPPVLWATFHANGSMIIVCTLVAGLILFPLVYLHARHCATAIHQPLILWIVRGCLVIVTLLNVTSLSLILWGELVPLAVCICAPLSVAIMYFLLLVFHARVYRRHLSKAEVAE